ncbi:MAG: ADOP family duplicated permease [Gemmatimonadales bacterium]
MIRPAPICPGFSAPVAGSAAHAGRRARRRPPRCSGDEIWRTLLGRSSVTGRAIQIDGRPVTVVGVLPAGFRVPQGPQLFRADIWIPLQFDSTEVGQRRSNFVWLTGRLRDDWTLAQATTELDGLMRGLTEQFPQLAGESLRLSALQPESRRSVRRPLLLLFAAVGFVLLIAASNVASLLLARGAERHREVAIRSALGADRSDIVREVLLEAGVLVGGGTVLGLGLAWLGVRIIGAMAAARQPQLAGLALDGPVVAFAVVLAVIVALACGVVPALRSARVDPQTTMRSSDARAGGDSGGHRFLRGLATTEVALSAVLLLGAGLVLRGFAGLLDEPTGFDDERLLTVQVTVDAEKYRTTSSVTGFLEPALAAIRAQAGVTGAGAINLVPYDNWGSNFNIRYEGQDATDPTRFPLAESRVVTPGVYEALGVQLVAGRLLGPEDADPDRPANVVVNEALVARDFAGQDPIGKRFHLGDTTFATIVGVVRDIKNFGPVERPHPEVDYHYAALSRPGAQYSLLVRTDGDPAGQAAAVRAAIRTVDPTAAVSLARPMRSVIEASVGRPRFFAALLGAFAGVAVLLTVAGLYGLMSYLVAQRTREIGIRMALGSTPARTRNLVLLQGGRMVGAGLLVGMVAAFWISRLLVGLLYGVSPLDPLTWLGAVGLVLLTALGALLLPARRATRVDPQRAIRSE